VDFGEKWREAGGARWVLRVWAFAAAGSRLVSFSHWFCARAGEIREVLAPGAEAEAGKGVKSRRVGRLGVRFLSHFSVLGRNCEAYLGLVVSCC
jgi:hypothetical protein